MSHEILGEGSLVPLQNTKQGGLFILPRQLSPKGHRPCSPGAPQDMARNMVPRAENILSHAHSQRIGQQILEWRPLWSCRMMVGHGAAAETTGSPELKLVQVTFPLHPHVGSLPKTGTWSEKGLDTLKGDSTRMGSLRLTSHQKPAWPSNQEHPHSPNPRGQWLQASMRGSQFKEARAATFLPVRHC